MTTHHPSHSHQHARVASDKIGPDDLRYADLVHRGFNRRFAGKPDYVRLVGSTEQVVDAVQEGTAWRVLWRTQRCESSSTPR